MTLKITFYDGIQYHRQDFLSRDADFFGAGVTKTTDFPVTFPATPNMTVNIGQGAAWVDGYRISNDSTPVTLTVAAADSNPRIDIIQIGHDDANSTYSLVVKKGVPASSSPVEPGADPGYVKIWAINVAAGVTSISLANFVDRRSLVPLNVDGSQISFAGVAGTNTANTFTGGNQIIGAQTAATLATQQVASWELGFSRSVWNGSVAQNKTSFLQVDTAGTFKLINEAGSSIWSAKQDGTVTTGNNTLDDGTGTAVFKRDNNNLFIDTATASQYATLIFRDNGVNKVQLFKDNATHDFIMQVQAMNALRIAYANGALTSLHNTLDDGTGNTSINGGTLSLANGTTNVIRLAQHGLGAPATLGTLSEGMKWLSWDDGNYGYGIGIDSNTQWYTSAQYHKWYTYGGGAVGATPTLAMTLDGEGNLTPKLGILFNDGQEHTFKYSNGSTQQWGFYVNSTAAGAYDWATPRHIFEYQAGSSALYLMQDSGSVHTKNNVLDDGAGAATFVGVTAGGMAIASGFPSLQFYESDAALNLKRWHIETSSGSLFLSRYNDDNTSGAAYALQLQNNLAVLTAHNTLDDGAGTAVVKSLGVSGGIASIGTPGTTAGSLGLYPAGAGAWYWITNNAGTIDFTDGSSPGGTVHLYVGSSVGTEHNVLDDGAGAMTLFGNLNIGGSTNTGNTGAARITKGDRATGSAVIQLGNNAGSGQVFEILNSSWTQIPFHVGNNLVVTTANNTLDDGAGGANIAGKAYRLHTFVPTTVGWYRIAGGGGSFGQNVYAGELGIYAEWNAQVTRAHLDIKGGGFGNSNSISQLNCIQYSGGLITQVRSGQSGGSDSYIDVYVASVAGHAGQAVYIYFWGDGTGEPNWVTSPVVGATPGSQANTLVLNNGSIGTTGDMYAGGNISGKNIANKTTADINIYVSTAGNDANDGSVGAPVKTFAAALAKIPQVVNHTVNINVVSGTYPESINVQGFTGGGTINIIGSNTGLANSVNYIASNLQVNRCYVPVVCQGLKFTDTTAHAVLVTYASYLNVINCTITDATASYDGVQVQNACCIVDTCTISNRRSAYNAAINAMIYAANNVGSGNQYTGDSNANSKLTSYNNSVTALNSYNPASGGEIIQSTIGVVNPWGDNTFAQRSYTRFNYTTPQALTASTNTKLVWGALSPDHLSEGSLANSRFTAKASGAYAINVGVSMGSGTNGEIQLVVYKNGSSYDYIYDHILGNTAVIPSGSTTVNLDPGDYIEIYIVSSINVSTAGYGYWNITRMA